MKFEIDPVAIQLGLTGIRSQRQVQPAPPAKVGPPGKNDDGL